MDEEQVMEQVTPEADCAAEFEELIRGRCRQPFQQRVQKILDGRLRTLRQENGAALRPPGWNAGPDRPEARR